MNVVFHLSNGTPHVNFELICASLSEVVMRCDEV